MTEQEKQELSKAVAKKYGIDAYTQDVSECGDSMPELWLHDDSARCFDLAVNNHVGIRHYADFRSGKCYSVESKTFNGRTVLFEDYDKHNNNPHEATRIAILRALLAKD